mgnify:CR=1 FL=1
MKKCIKIILIVIVILIVLSIGCLLVYNRWPDPPIKELQMASDALTLARQVEAYKYAPELFNITIQLYDSSMNNWKIENGKFILNRNFEFQTTLK